MNNQLVEIHLPIRQWAKLLRTLTISLLEKDEKCFKEKDRVDYDNREIYDQIIDCLVWDYITPALKYSVDLWDTEHYIGKLIDGYSPVSVIQEPVYKEGSPIITVEEVCIDDPLSYWFTQGPLLRIQDSISDFFLELGLALPQWEIVELINCEQTKVLRIGGDWRARAYCQQTGIPYDF